MSLRNILSAASQGASGPSSGLYVDDVFSTYLYTGNGSTQTITNGIDLAGSGGMVWIKGRTNTEVHALFDTTRGINKYLSSNNTTAQVAGYTDLVTAFNTNGFSLGADASTIGLVNNGTTIKFSQWTFRKAPKFFDCGTYVGTGVTRTIAHSLGQAPGMIIIKQTSASSNWIVYHRQLTSAQYILQMNTTGFQSPQSSVFNSTAPTSTVFQLGTDLAVNDIGQSYVYYAFAHDSMADGIIQCGSFTTDGSGNATVTLGWEPQFLQAKASSTTGAWFMLDQMRGWNMSTDENLLANSSNAEITGTNYGNPTATGFYITNHTASATYVYLAIRRPNKPPTIGTQVFMPFTGTASGSGDAGTRGTGTFIPTGWPVDLVVGASRTVPGQMWQDRLRGNTSAVYSHSTSIEETTSIDKFWFNYSTGVEDCLWGDYTGASIYNFAFKRAPGVFDVVCYTGTGSATTVAHGIGVAPELMIVKRRSTAFGWYVYHKDMAATEALILNDTLAKLTGNNAWGNTAPTAAAFSVSNAGDNSTNASGSTYVWYGFATKAGISKVSSYTGNGGTQTINCGFTTGARFVLIKRTDSTGDWYVWDTARGIIAGNDPHLSLNTTAAEVTTDDSIDPDPAGFVVNQLASTNINVTSATYIYLAFA